PPTLSAACALLARAISPSSLRRQIGGPRDAVQAFLSALPDVQTSRKTFSSIACSASLRTLPASPLPGKAGGGRTEGPLQRYTIRSARPEDAPGVLPLVRQFSAFTSTGPSPDETVLADMRAAAAARMLYAIYAEEEAGEHAAGHAVLGARSSEGKRAWRGEGNVAGYLLLGFATPRAVVIRHVFVHPEHRKRGLAERIVCAVTRACLGASPEPELDPDANGSVSVQFVADTPGCGVKSAVCLFYNDPGAARVYRRCGFVVGEDARDPVSGESLCYAYELRDIVTPNVGFIACSNAGLSVTQRPPGIRHKIELASVKQAVW
ncbi:hypothetical protein EVJ58_g10922, partial [Rhodofomes roseus]